MAFVDTLTDAERRKYRRYAYVSTWFGCVADMMFDNSAIFVLYFVALHASNTTVMLSTSFSGLSSLILLIPAARLVDRFGVRRVVTLSCLLICIPFLFMASLPWFGGAWTGALLLLGSFVFAFSRPTWGAAWYPLLQDILKPEERADFFGMMRFSYNLVDGGAFFLLGLAMGKNPPLIVLQAAIAVGGLCALVRLWCIYRIRLSPHVDRPDYDLKKALSISLNNRPLLGYTTYTMVLNCAMASLVTLALLFLKTELHLASGTVQMLSTLLIAGAMCGYFFYGHLERRFGRLKLIVACHILHFAVLTTMFFCGRGMPYAAAGIGAGLFLFCFTSGISACVYSQQMMSLARPGNLAMACALSGTYASLGSFGGRMMTSALLGGGMLASAWQAGGMEFCKIQTLYLLSGGILVFALVLLVLVPGVVRPVQEER